MRRGQEPAGGGAWRPDARPCPAPHGGGRLSSGFKAQTQQSSPNMRGKKKKKKKNPKPRELGQVARILSSPRTGLSSHGAPVPVSFSAGMNPRRRALPQPQRFLLPAACFPLPTRRNPDPQVDQTRLRPRPRSPGSASQASTVSTAGTPARLPKCLPRGLVFHTRRGPRLYDKRPASTC